MMLLACSTRSRDFSITLAKTLFFEKTLEVVFSTGLDNENCPASPVSPQHARPGVGLTQESP
jgi:hypothetical protein